jgi:hypothetical protein
MSQLRVSTVATTAGVVNATTNALGANPSNAIAVHAVRTGSPAGTNDGTYIKWNTFVVSSPYYDAVTGLFTAPIAGKYFVSGHVIITPPGSSYLRLYKNGVIQSYSHVNLSGTWAHITVTGIVQCNVGDTIGIGTAQSYYANEHNGFTLYYLGL